MAQKDGRARNWTFVVYPGESLPETYWDIITEELHLTGAFSPLHDRDVNPTGEVKKAHQHVILTFPGNKSYEQVKEITDRLGGAPPKVLENVTGMVRYFTHMDNPEKAQYERSEIRSFGGFSAENYLALSSAEVSKVAADIRDFCRENQITEFATLIDACDDLQKSEWLYVLEHRETMFFKAWLQSRHYVAKDARKSVPAIPGKGAGDGRSSADDPGGAAAHE